MNAKIINPGRPLKGALKCNLCRNTCSPKNGDWFISKASQDQQVFLCADCERKSQGSYKRAVGIK